MARLPGGPPRELLHGTLESMILRVLADGRAHGYGVGSIERSLDIARTHLDFFAFTGHSSWHDMPSMEGGRERHWIDGFRKLAEVDKVPFVITGWTAVVAAIAPLATESKVYLLSASSASPALRSVSPYFQSTWMFDDETVRLILPYAAQKLDVEVPFGDGPAAVKAAVEHLGYVQIDTINVIERCHHHILFNRIPDYRRADLRHDAAGPDWHDGEHERRLLDCAAGRHAGESVCRGQPLGQGRTHPPRDVHFLREEPEC